EVQARGRAGAGRLGADRGPPPGNPRRHRAGTGTVPLSRADEQCGGASVASGGDWAETVFRYAVGRGKLVWRAVTDGGGNLPAAAVERVLLAGLCCGGALRWQNRSISLVWDVNLYSFLFCQHLLAPSENNQHRPGLGRSGETFWPRCPVKSVANHENVVVQEIDAFHRLSLGFLAILVQGGQVDRARFSAST